MDVDEPDKDGKPSIKVIPFPARTNAADWEANSAMDEEQLKRIVAEAIDESTWSKTQQEDHEALESERAFRRRFGFVVNRAQRQRVLELKYADDLTDNEIRQLRRSASLDLKSNPARNTASPLLQWFGYALVAMVCLQMLLGILAVIRGDERTLPQFAQIVAFEAVLVCMLVVADYFYIRPNQIRLRALREAKR